MYLAISDLCNQSENAKTQAVLQHQFISSMGRATIFRTLKKLEERNKISKSSETHGAYTLASDVWWGALDGQTLFLDRIFSCHFYISPHVHLYAWFYISDPKNPSCVKLGCCWTFVSSPRRPRDCISLFWVSGNFPFAACLLFYLVHYRIRKRSWSAPCGTDREHFGLLPGIQNAQRHKQNDDRATVEQYMGQFAFHVGDHVDH